MTWLDLCEITANNVLHHLDKGMSELEEKLARDNERVAHVIRELAEIFKYFLQHADIVHTEHAEQLGKMYDNLSPDAKEVIDDTTATRST